MNRNVRHGIIYGENDPLIRKSCVIFKSQYCLAPASVLLNSFENIRHNYGIQKDLKISRIIDTKTDRRYSNLNDLNFKIVHEFNDVLYESDATIVYIFKCRNIWNSFNDILRNFVARSTKTENNDLLKLLLSSFIILELKVTGAKTNNTKNLSLAIFESIKESFGLNGKQKCRQNEAFRMSTVHKLENIESISTPFGNECFLNTINVGRIANIFGDNKCLMVASMPLVNGCEGGAVYNKNEDIIGIVVSTTFHWNSENATLTLVAKFNEIIAEFVEQTKLTSVNIESEFDNCHSKSINNLKLNCKSIPCIGKDSMYIENYIVLIQSDESWGSGCFVIINDVRVIITCAHVLENHDGKVRCTWKFGYFESRIIFKNPFFDQAFDIAILEAPLNVPEQYFTKCLTAPTKIGQTVYSSGFPHFTSLGKVHEFFPSIFEGRITKISKGVIFSDASVQSGQSGGPMFADDGHLIGITVSNSKDDTYQLIYPNINMSVPVYEILPILQQYGKTKDERDLQNLVANKEVKSIWALETPKILCRL